jgi:hypothetical protein
MADKLTRNEIVSSNEFRQFIGLKPSSDPRADELINKNIAHPEQEVPSSSTSKDKDAAKKELELMKELSSNGGKNQNG